MALGRVYKDCYTTFGWRVNRRVYGAGHWLLPIQGGHVSKQTAPICRLLDDTDFTARDIGIIGRKVIGRMKIEPIDIGLLKG